jgi:hypothetical protein
MTESSSMDGTAGRAIQQGLDAMVTAYESCRFAPLTEADLQCHLYAGCLQSYVSESSSPYPLHANWKLAARPPELARAKFDLILGQDEVVVEIKFEADYPGVSKPVCFPREIAKDVARLELARQHGVRTGLLIMIDEDGTHRRNLRKYVSVPLDWRELQRVDGRPSYLLELRC